MNLGRLGGRSATAKAWNNEHPVLFISGVATSVSEWTRFHSLTLAATLQNQSPQASTLYTKVAKSAKKELELVSSFALFAILV
jgi:hypothetical protein